MKKIVVFAVLLCCFYSCNDVDIYTVKETEPIIVCCTPPPIFRSRLKLRLVDSNKNWSKSVDDKNLKLINVDENWNPVANDYIENIHLSRNKDLSLESISVHFVSSSKGYRFFKLKRNENTEDKIICVYKDFNRDKSWEEILTMIIYNGKEYKVNNENLDDGEHEKGFVVTPIDILVE